MKLFLKIWQNLQENTFIEVSFSSVLKVLLPNSAEQLKDFVDQFDSMP